MTSYLITIHDGHYYSWWLINIHDYANHAYSYIFIIMQIRPDPWPPKVTPDPYEYSSILSIDYVIPIVWKINKKRQKSRI